MRFLAIGQDILRVDTFSEQIMKDGDESAF
jgi:hypothetical protein